MLGIVKWYLYGVTHANMYVYLVNLVLYVNTVKKKYATIVL
jgi:hypothetical protein